MAYLKNRNDFWQDPKPHHEMHTEIRGIRFGRFADTEISVGWSLPILFGVLLGTAWYLGGRPGDDDLPLLAGILILAVTFGAIWQSVVRYTATRLMGGLPIDLTFRAFGCWGTTEFLGGWRRVFVACVVPIGSLGLAAWLAVIPPDNAGWAGFRLDPRSLAGQLTLLSVIHAGVWVVLLQAIAQCLPLPGCHGREALVGLVEVIGWRRNETVRRQAIAVLMGSLAIGLLGYSVFLFFRQVGQINGIPHWIFFALLGCACWASRRMEEFSLMETTKQFDMFDARGLFEDTPPHAENDPGFLASPISWLRARRTVRRLQKVRQNEHAEAADVAKLDGILERLHTCGMDNLSRDDAVILQRVSERLRKETT